MLLTRHLNLLLVDIIYESFTRDVERRDSQSKCQLYGKIPQLIHLLIGLVGQSQYIDLQALLMAQLLHI